MTLPEYIRYHLQRDIEKEKEVETKKIERKRKNFDNLDAIAANIQRQREAKTMAYEDFDYKERVSSLGRGVDSVTKCWSCGKEIDEKADTCDECGAKQRV